MILLMYLADSTDPDGDRALLDLRRYRDVHLALR